MGSLPPAHLQLADLPAGPRPEGLPWFGGRGERGIPRNRERPQASLLLERKAGDQDPPGLSQPLRVTARARGSASRPLPKATTQTRPSGCHCPPPPALLPWEWASPQSVAPLRVGNTPFLGRHAGQSQKRPPGGGAAPLRGPAVVTEEAARAPHLLSPRPREQSPRLSSSLASAAAGELPDGRCLSSLPGGPAAQPSRWACGRYGPIFQTERLRLRTPAGRLEGAPRRCRLWGLEPGRLGSQRRREALGGAGVEATWAGCPAGRATCRISRWRRCFILSKAGFSATRGTWSLRHPPGARSPRLCDGTVPRFPVPCPGRPGARGTARSRAACSRVSQGPPALAVQGAGAGPGEACLVTDVPDVSVSMGSGGLKQDIPCDGAADRAFLRVDVTPGTECGLFAPRAAMKGGGGRGRGERGHH